MLGSLFRGGLHIHLRQGSNWSKLLIHYCLRPVLLCSCFERRSGTKFDKFS